MTTTHDSGQAALLAAVTDHQATQHGGTSQSQQPQQLDLGSIIANDHHLVMIDTTGSEAQVSPDSIAIHSDVHHHDSAATTLEMITNHTGPDGTTMVVTMSLADDQSVGGGGPGSAGLDASLMQPPPLSRAPQHQQLQQLDDNTLSQITATPTQMLTVPSIVLTVPVSSTEPGQNLLIKEEGAIDEQLYLATTPITVITTTAALEMANASTSDTLIISTTASSAVCSSATATSTTTTTNATTMTSISTGSGIRKSTRLSNKPAKSYSQMEEMMEVNVDPSSIRRHQSDLQTDDLDEPYDEDGDEEELEEDELNHQEGLDEDFDDLDFDEDFDEGDDDEYRPLKKRKLNRTNASMSLASKRSSVQKKSATSNTYNSTRSRNRTLHPQQTDRSRYLGRIQNYRAHRFATRRMLDILSTINSVLISKIFRTIRASDPMLQTTMSEDVSIDIEQLAQLLSPDDPFFEELTQLSQSYKEALAAKETLDRAMEDGDLEEQEDLDEFMNTANGTAETEVAAAAVKNGVHRGASSSGAVTSGQSKRGRKLTKVAVSSPVSKSKSATTKAASSTSNKRSRRKKKPSVKSAVVVPKEELEGENDDELGGKNTYHPCPWPNCTYESKREWALNEHINLTHTGLKQFGCKVDGCPATFFGSAELDNHMKKYHAEVASKEFMPCTWPGCNALFKSKLGLRAHLQVHKGENLIPCDWPGCNYFAKNKRQSENHLRKHTGDRPFSCDYPGCDSKFRTNDSLRHHKKSHSEYRPFRCDWPGCDANFKTNRGLTIHRALHTGEKLFKCDWADCEYASERKYHVDLHIFQEHTHVKPYQCNWAGCDASFLRNDKLQNHLKIHRQEKPFKCIHPSCDKHFVEKGNMMKHYNNVHKR